MGLLSYFKASSRSPAPLPSGSFTVDSTGEILTSTVSSSFSKENLKLLSSVILDLFRQSKAAGENFTEVSVQFGALTLKARELRGGAIIFLSPRASARS